MTLSGGESLCQPEFAAALLKAAQESGGIHTAMESMGCADWKMDRADPAGSGSVPVGYQTYGSGQAQGIYRKEQ